MNQQTLQKIYKSYEPCQYYNRFFEVLKLREDSREMSKNRDIKISLTQKSLAISRGQTIIICQLSSVIQKVIHNPTTNTYGKPLININITLPNMKGYLNRENKPGFALKEFVQNKIQCNGVERQLVVKELGNKYFAHTLQIDLRVVADDGMLNQTALIAVQLILWTAKFQKIDSETGQLKSQFFMLEIPYFLYPSKYCEIMSQLLVDPTQSEQQNSSYTISIISDLLSQKIDKDYRLIQKTKKDCDKIPKVIIDSIVNMWKVQMSKFTFDIKQLRRKVNTPQSINQSIDLLITQ